MCEILWCNLVCAVGQCFDSLSSNNTAGSPAQQTSCSRWTASPTDLLFQVNGQAVSKVCVWCLLPPPPLPWPLLGVSDCCWWYDDVFVVWWHDMWICTADIGCLMLQTCNRMVRFVFRWQRLWLILLFSSHHHLHHGALQLLHHNSGTCVLTATVHGRGGGGGCLVGSAVTLASYWMHIFVRRVPCCILDWKRIAE